MSRLHPCEQGVNFLLKIINVPTSLLGTSECLLTKNSITARTKDRFCKMSPRTSVEELKAPHMFIKASVTAGRNGVKRVRFLLALKYWLKPQIARTALMRTIVGLSAVRPLTVARGKYFALSWNQVSWNKILKQF